MATLGESEGEKKEKERERERETDSETERERQREITTKKGHKSSCSKRNKTRYVRIECTNI